MPSELVIHAVNDAGMRVTAGDGEHTITMDYPTAENGHKTAGLTPLRTLLASLAACSSTSLAYLLRKMRQPVTTVEVNASGRRRDEHPTVITDIDLEFVVHGTGIDAAAVEKALRLADDEICPVWAMLKPGTPIATSYRLEP